MEEQSEKTKKSGINPLMIGGIVVLVLLLVWGFMSRSGTNSTSQEETTINDQEIAESQIESTTTSQEATEMLEEGEARIISVEGGSFYYKPNEIRVKKGEKVKIEMTSVDMMHDFVIDELGVRMPVTKAGEIGTVEFTADQVGEYEFYCSVGQHRANGQVGKLIVEE